MPPTHRTRLLAAALVTCTTTLAGCGSAAAPVPPAVQETMVPSAVPSGPPGPSTTGVPAGTQLRRSGPLRITTPGTVIDGLDVSGSIVIAAPDVVIRNTRVTANSADVARVIEGSDDAQNVMIEDVEVDGAGLADIGVDVSRATLSRLDVHGANDGVRMGRDIVLQDSWVHDLVRKGELHPDAVQGISAKDVQIIDNVLDPRATEGDLGNAAIMLSSDSGDMTSRNVVIRGNVLDGGNYSINISKAIDAQGFVVDDNTFGGSARYGPVVTPDGVHIGPGNTMSATGGPIEVDRPAF